MAVARGDARILRLAPGAATRLAHGSSARVHSVFERAINLQDVDGRLLTLHGPGWLRAPFSAACDRLPAVSSGARAWLGPGGVWIGTDRDDFLDGGGALVAVDERPSLPGQQPAAIMSNHGAPRLAQSARTLRARFGDAGRAASGVLARHAPALAGAIVAADVGGMVKAARGLIGCGEGLTPAGDDCLVGALAVLWHYGPGWSRRIGRLRETLAALADDGTTTIAAEFIHYALAGQFAEPLLHALATGEAAPLLACGATSGADTLFGASVALDALLSS
jgi:hypothetical protein